MASLMVSTGGLEGQEWAAPGHCTGWTRQGDIARLGGGSPSRSECHLVSQVIFLVWPGESQGAAYCGSSLTGQPVTQGSDH